MIQLKSGLEERAETSIRTSAADGVQHLEWQRVLEAGGYVLQVEVKIVGPGAVPEDVLRAECPAACVEQLLAR